MWLGLLVLASGLIAAIYGMIFLQFRVLRKRKSTHTKSAASIGFVHPAAHGGGGGERVLWVAIQALQDSDIEANIERRYVLYSGPMSEKEKDANEGSCFKPSAVVLAEKQFGVKLRRRVELAQLHPLTCRLQDPSCYPRLTLILQSLVGGIALGLNVLQLGVCDLMVDSVGIAFAYPLYRYAGGCKVAAYVHYPTVSTDMMRRVADGTATYNNAGHIAKSPLLSKLKMLYYRAFAVVYGWVGRRADVVMTNSSWTHGHIRDIWNTKCPIVFPPVNVATFSKFDLPGRSNAIVSIGQFRPEKNHMLQLKSFAKAIPELPEDATLYLVGGARNAEDRARVTALEEEVKSLGIQKRVKIEVSVPFSRIQELLATSAIGLHSMTDEHFGIVVVEYLAAGCVALAHNSGGVKADIVDPLSNGLLATTEQEFSDGLVSLLNLHRVQRAVDENSGAAPPASKTLLPLSFREMQLEGRKKSQKFTDEHFGASFIAQLVPVLSV